MTDTVDKNQAKSVAVGENTCLELGRQWYWELSAYVTDLASDQLQAWQVVGMYAKRADCENTFDDLKRHWGLLQP